MRYTGLDGRAVKLTLGPVDLSDQELPGAPQIGQPLTPVAARRLAATIRQQLKLGVDVAALRRAERILSARRGRWGKTEHVPGGGSGVLRAGGQRSEGQPKVARCSQGRRARL